MSTARLQIRLPGPFRLRQGDQPIVGFDQARLQHLLAYLTLHRDASVSRQEPAFLLWPDCTTQQALKNLRTLLTRLRQALPVADEFVCVTTQTLLWRTGAPSSWTRPTGVLSLPASRRCFCLPAKAPFDKIMGGSEFKGTPNDLVWAEKRQAKL